MKLGRRRAVLLVAAGMLVVGLLLALAMFPVGWAKPLVEKRLSKEVGSAVSIGEIARESVFSFTPTLVIRRISVPQPRWAGTGHLAAVEALRVKVAVLPMLVGRVRPQLLSAEGVHLDLLRTADGRANWKTGDAKDEGGGLDLSGLSEAKGQVRYRDEKQKRAFALSVRIAPGRGIVASGTGAVDGNPVKLSLTGAAPTGGRAWPFDAAIEGPALAMRFKGTMAAPLDTQRMTFSVDARASDLKLIDRVIEAGLFGTQPVALHAEVVRTPHRWSIKRLAGKVGTSPIDGRLEVVREDERTKLDGEVHSPALDFEDLASDAGNAVAAAIERAQGLRLVPNLRVNIRKIDDTDGRIAFRIDRVVSKRRPSSLRSARGMLLLDHRLLKIENLAIGLSKGEIVGSAIVDQRQGQPRPTITLTLDLKGSSIDALAGGDGAIDAPVSGRVRLAGVGDTIREAVGTGSGRIGLYAGEGVLPEKLARLLGFDLGALLGGGDDRATLRCAAIGLDLRRGIGQAAQLIVDTSVSQSRGSGTVRFPDEALALTLTGTPKAKVTLRLPGSALVRGTIREPAVMVPKEVKSVGNVLKAIGNAITGKDGPRAVDADCAGLMRATVG